MRSSIPLNLDLKEIEDKDTKKKITHKNEKLDNNFDLKKVMTLC